MKVGIILFDNFTDADFFLHWDFLNRVKLFNLHDDWQVAILGTAATHLSAAGLKVETTGSIDDVKSCDGVLLCSGFGTRDLIGDQAYLDRLTFRQNQIIAMQCSGSLILGAKGMLNDVKVTAYPPIVKLLKEYGAQPIDNTLVVDGQLASASSCLGSVLLSSYLIENLIGESARQEVVKSIRPVSGFTDFSERCSGKLI